MPRSHKPRKRYVPKPPRLDAHLHAIDRIATLLPEQRTKLTRPTQAALDAFRQGRGSLAHWWQLAGVYNVGAELALAHIGGRALVPIFEAAHQALASVHARYLKRQSWTLTGPELQAFAEACEWAAWQMTQATQGELRDAIDRVDRRNAGALAGNVGRDTTVCVGGSDQAGAVSR